MRLNALIGEYDRRRQALGLFDLNVWLGTPLEPGFSPAGDFEGLKAGLARCDIRRAVVSHTLCKRYDATMGNLALIDAIRTDEAFHGAAVLVPNPRPTRSWLDELRELAAAKIRAVRLFPKSHGFALSPWCVGDLLRSLEALSIPLMLWHTEASWDSIADLCREYPGLPVIVEGTGRKLFYDNRVYYRLLEQCPNLYLETHNITNYLGLDDLVARFGAERFLFGSYSPCQDPNAAIMLLTHGQLTQADRTNIAHRNLERLIEGVTVQ